MAKCYVFNKHILPRQIYTAERPGEILGLFVCYYGKNYGSIGLTGFSMFNLYKIHINSFIVLFENKNLPKNLFLHRKMLTMRQAVIIIKP